jgi:hypothetical protein
MCTYETYSYSSMTLVVHHKSLRLILSLCNVYLWDPFSIRLWDPNLWGPSPCSSDLWDPTACVPLVLVDPSPSDLWAPKAPFSIFIWLVGPDGLRVTCIYETIRPLGPDDLCVTCTWGPFSISIWPVGPDGLHVTCCRWGLINSN